MDLFPSNPRHLAILDHGVSGGAAPAAPAGAGASSAGGQATTAAKPGGPPAMLPAPFVRGAHEHVEPFDDFTSAVLGATTQTRGPIDIPAYGYVRHVLLLVQATGGVNAGTTTFAGDGPWIAIQNIQLTDVNGAFIVGPLNGFDLYTLNKFGAYWYESDPNMSPAFSAVSGAAASGNFSFILRLPIEICQRDGLGALPNQNAASTYKVLYTLNTSANVYTAAPTTTPVVRVRLFLEAWSQPLSTDVRGMPQATVPPAMGTTQFWSKFTKSVSAGFLTIQLPRVGNLLRNIIFILYNNASPAVRTDTQFPDPIQILWDARLLLNEAELIRKQYEFERYDYAGAIGGISGAAAIQEDVGVFVYDFTHEFSGHAGFELRDLWIPTTQATRLEISGTWGPTSGTLVVLTNDVAPVGDVAVG